MSYKNGMAMFDAVTNIDENLIEQAENYVFPKAKERLFRTVGAAAAAVIVLVGIPAFMMFTVPKASGGIMLSGNADEPSYYEAPVLPLTALTDTEGLTAERETELDLSGLFSCVTLTGGYYAGVTDSYTLTNTTEEDITVQAAYPYSGTIGNISSRMIPTVTVDGEEIAAEIYAGSYTANHNGTYDNGRYFSDFSDYEALLSDGDYLKKAVGSVPSLDIPVTVYRVTDYGCDWSNGIDTAYSLAVNMKFSSDHAMVYTVGFNSYQNGMNGTYRVGFFLSGGDWLYETNHRYIIVIDGELSEMSIQGYRNGGCRDGDEIDGIFGRIEKTDLTLEDIIRDYAENNGAINSTDELLIDKVAEQLWDMGVLSERHEGFTGGFLGDIVGTVYSLPRLMYRVFWVTVPAGGSVNVTAVSESEASRLYDENDKRYFTFELAPTLGSGFAFTSQTAYIPDTGGADVTGDIGSTPQELDIAQPYYTINVRPAKAKQ